MSSQTNFAIFRVILGKVKARRSQIYSIYWKIDYQHCRTLATFLFENSCCCFLKTLFETDITEFSTEPKDSCTCVDQGCSGNFISTGALLGIFAYICRQQLIINWRSWRSGALATWHHWCGGSKTSTGSNWIPVECSSETNVFRFWKLLVKRRYLQFFHSSQTFTGNSYCVWVYLQLLEGRSVHSCKLNVKLGPPLSL